MNVLGARASGASVGIFAAAAATLVAVFKGDGNPAVALAPVLVLLGAAAVWKLPLRYTVVALLLAVLCLDNPFEIPFNHMWESPIGPLGRLLYDNLHKFTGISALRFSLLTVLILFLLAVAVYRRARYSGVDRGVLETPRCLKLALLLCFLTLVGLELMGILRGGDMAQSLWQIQCLLFTPLVAALWQFGVRGPKDFRAVGRVVLVSACFKVALGAYFLYRIARPSGVEPPYVTQHSDSLLFVTGVMIAVALWMERPSVKHTLLVLGVVPVLVFGIVINDRRLAWVSLGASLLTVFLMSPANRSKRFIARTALMMVPLLIPYTLLGWSSQSKIFKPVQVVRSVVANDASGSDADSSTEFRNQENYNLIRTWMPNPVFGSGFGHEYNEVILLPDISRFFPAYRFVPHNSVLWLWGIGGVVGFSGIWLFLVLGVMLAARGYRAAKVPEDRAAALVCICIVVSFLNQAFGDMGTQSWISVFLVAPAVVMGAKLAVSTGAWPAHRLQLRTGARPLRDLSPAAVAA